jgi:spore photoproduct lyase
MGSATTYEQKFNRISDQTLFPLLQQEKQLLLRDLADHFRFTLQELRLVAEICRDLDMWQEWQLMEALWPDATNEAGGDREAKKRFLEQLTRQWNRLKAHPNRYLPVAAPEEKTISATSISREKEKLGLGFCPVASPKTRCCNLLTLDAVDNCGYGCSYCSIQSFFSDNQVFFDPTFGEKLHQLEIDPGHTYHIGTGQSSDSLMWGNSHGVLDAQLEFAERHPNVILEFKTKSANIKHLLNRQLPPNIICTWSLNTQTMVENEELGSAPLQKRLDAASRIADKGTVIGFHFHPMIHYQGWEEEYADLFAQLQQRFDPQQVALVSLGTLTFIKPVLKQIRQRGGNSQILKMPLVEADGKLSYPDEIKLQLFTHAYQSFGTSWKESVFFYLCMEHQRFWQPVFGYEYSTNEAFEAAMKGSYVQKIQQCRMNQAGVAPAFSRAD